MPPAPPSFCATRLRPLPLLLGVLLLGCAEGGVPVVEDSGATERPPVADAGEADDAGGPAPPEALPDGGSEIPPDDGGPHDSGEPALDGGATNDDGGPHDSGALGPDAAVPDDDGGAAETDPCFSAPLPEPWQASDVGEVEQGGSGATGGTFCIQAAGSDIWRDADAFRFLHVEVAGDVELTARVASLEAVHPYTKAGLMVRASLSPGSPHAMVNTTPSEGQFLTYREVESGMSASLKRPAAPGPVWLRVSRRGQRVTGEVSTDGTSWDQIGEVVLPALPATAYVGLAFTSHDVAVAGRADFEEVALGVPAPLEDSCGDGLCLGAETCSTCSADCSCEAIGQGVASYSPTPPPALARPLVGSPVTAGGFTYTRVIDSGPPLLSAGQTRTYYSNVPAFNADDTLLRLSGSRPALLDGETLQFIRLIDGVGLGHLSWLQLPENRTKLFGTSTSEAVLVDAYTDEREVLYDFSAEYDRVTFGPGEGSVSHDDRRVALVGRKDGDAHVIAFDLEAREIVGATVFAGRWPQNENRPRFDYAMISAGGDYVLVNTRYQGSGGIWRYDVDTMEGLQLTSLGKHSDVCFDQAGDEVLVTLVSPPELIRLRDGYKRVLPTGSFPGHVSCRNTQRPGWVYMTRHVTREILAVRLDDSGVIERFGWHRSTADQYQSEAHGSPSRDGRRVIFNSDWGDEDALAHAYLVSPTP